MASIPKARTIEKCDVLKRKLLEFFPSEYPAHLRNRRERDAFGPLYPFIVNYKEKANYYFLFEKYSNDPTKIGATEGEMFKVIYAKRGDCPYEIGDVVCTDTAATQNGVNVCFNIHKEPIEDFTQAHISFMFNTNAVLVRVSPFYQGYLYALKEMEQRNDSATGNNTPNARNGNRLVSAREWEEIQEERQIMKSFATEVYKFVQDNAPSSIRN